MTRICDGCGLPAPPGRHKYVKGLCQRCYARIWARAHRQANAERRKTYYEMLLRDQCGLCKICGAEPNGRRLDVDHNHKTGVVRGLLCRGCNNMLGHVQDNPTVLRSAANYLELGVQ